MRTRDKDEKAEQEERNMTWEYWPEAKDRVNMLVISDWLTVWHAQPRDTKTPQTVLRCDDYFQNNKTAWCILNYEEGVEARCL